MKDTSPAQKAPLSQLQVFFVKVMTITAALLVVIFFTAASLQSALEKQAESFKGGPAFWEGVEAKLYRLAEERDLPPEKKQKIIAALAKLSDKYKPYFDALGGQTPKP